MSTFKLSTIQPDYEQINNQLTAYLSNKESWASTGNSKTGTLLIEAISAVGALDQYSIWAAVNETTLENAVLEDSIYTNNIFLGNHISRATPAHCQVSIQNTNYNQPYLEIPKFTQFSVEGVDYFNREPIVFDNQNMQQTVTLHQGTIKNISFTSDGSDLQEYLIESDNPFEISDEDILCYVGNTEYTKTTEAIFTYESYSTIFYENSTAQGNVKVLFGDGVYGAVPSSGESILFIYAVTTGSAGNNASVNQQVSCSDFTDVIGETITNPNGGDDARDISYYQKLGSQSAAANNRGISREDMHALLCRYPGIIDGHVYCQAEIAPLDKDWMNVFGLLILTKEGFTTQNWKDLVAYMQNHSVPGFQYVRYDAEPVDIDINVTFYLKKGASLTSCKEHVEAAIRNYLKLQTGCLGRSFYKSDLEDIAFSVLPTTIDYIERIAPMVDYVINKNQYINLKSLNVSCKYSERDSQYWRNPIQTEEG